MGSSVSNKQDAFKELKLVIEQYKPGQSNIDGGGFQIITYDPDSGYMYVQFESLKNGFVDDLELACIDNIAGTSRSSSTSVQVRSSSRLGYLDFGVNAKRINYIAKMLREKGWDAPGVDLSTHSDHAMQNGIV